MRSCVNFICVEDKGWPVLHRHWRPLPVRSSMTNPLVATQGRESPIGPQIRQTEDHTYEGDARRVLLDRRVQQVERLFLIAHPYLTDRQIVGGNKSALSRRPQNFDQIQGFRPSSRACQGVGERS